MKQLSFFLIGISLTTHAFANQRYYINCNETFINPATGSEIQGGKNWRFTLRENELHKKVSELNAEHKYQFTTETVFETDSSFGASPQFLSRLPGGFDFQLLFGVRVVPSLTEKPFETAKAKEATPNQEVHAPLLDLQQHDETPHALPPIQVQSLPIAPAAAFNIPQDAKITAAGDLRIKTMYKPRLGFSSMILPTQPETATVLNWGPRSSRTVHIYQPFGGGHEHIKLTCDKFLAQ